MSDGEPLIVSQDHEYCPLTGFCMRCGLHHEMAAVDELMCVRSAKTVSISHIRARQIADRRGDALVPALGSDVIPV